MRRWILRVALGAGGLVVAGGVGVLLALVLARPGVHLASSSTALASVEINGAGSHLRSLRATTQGKAIPVTERDGGAWPTIPLPQGEAVKVTATVAAPSWLQWLVGTSATSSIEVRTPRAVPVTTVGVATASRKLPVRFATPVRTVEYELPGSPLQMLRLTHPSAVVLLPVPAAGYTGTISLEAAARSWEKLATPASTMAWFVPPVKGEPAALAVPPPGGTLTTAQSPITITFSEPVAKVLGTSRPTISPSVAGSWSEPDTHTLEFTPSGFGFGPDTTVTVRFDRTVSLVSSPTDPSSTTSYQFTVGPGSILRLQQLLAQLGYLPLTFTPAPGTTQPTTLAGEEATVYHPLAGSFAWRWAGTPASLAAEWAPGADTPMTKGALMQFEAADNTYDDTVENETLDQMATASVWTALLKAALANQRDPYPYSYVYVTKVLPETLTLWENGQVVLTSLANTGIPQSPTADGTYPIYLRYTFQIMRGYNPNGSYYADPVHWINYFNGGDAVHGFVRAAYGFPQSLGCVELPVPTAATVFPKLAIGDLVTVAG